VACVITKQNTKLHAKG